MSDQRSSSKSDRRHRKSMSASDAHVGVMTDTEQLFPTRNAEAGPSVSRSRHSRHPTMSAIGSLSEAETMRKDPRTPTKSRRALSGEDQRGAKERDKGKGRATLSDVQTWIVQAMSLRSSRPRRLASLNHIEQTLVAACASRGADPEERPSTEQGVSCEEILSLELHNKLLVLLARHTQALTARAQAHSSLHPDDELAAACAPELNVVLALLQGLCLLSEACQLACAEEWVMEMLIDLLLLLRAVRRTPSKPQATDAKERPIALDILELLFCILVDSPEHTRTFERLGGLEATTRVLKGTGVDKEVKMRCLEFLYFYLLPEQTASTSDDPSLRSASGSSSTTASSEPYPPSPLSTTSRIEDSRELLSRHPATAGLEDPSSAFLAASRMSSQPAFIPQTPKKKSQPALGFATPSAAHARKSSGSNVLALGYGHAGGGVLTSGAGSAASRRSITPTLETVPPSPEVFVQARKAEDGSSGRSRELGTPVKRGGSTSSRGSSGLQRSSTMVDLSAAGHGDGDRRVTAIHQKRPSDAQLNVNMPPTAARRSMPPPASPARFLQASDVPPVPNTPRRSSGDSASTPRRSSTMLALNQAAQTRDPSAQRAPTSSHAFKVPSTPTSTPAGLPSAPSTPKSSKAPRTRHSLAPSHTYTSLSTAGAPPVPAMKTPSSSRTGSRGSDAEGAGAKTPSRIRRSETGLPPVTRVPPSPSMGALGLGRGMPLRESRRVVSRGNSGHESEGGVGEGRGETKDKGMKSVQEKKELLSSWIGNVDELVQSVQQVNPPGRQR